MPSSNCTEDITTAERPLSCGLPQASPASPVLFMLYLEPLFKLNSPKQAFGYADDVAFLRTRSTLERATAKLATNLEAALKWGIQNGISFDPEKCELQHFTRKNGPSNPRLKLETLNISPNKATRWLGIFLDKRLSFRTHVEHWTGKAIKVVEHLRTLENT